MDKMAAQTTSIAVLPTKCHTRRKMTDQEKIDYKRRRLLRACSACASSKRKCSHNQIDREDDAVDTLEHTGLGFDNRPGQGILTLRARTPTVSSSNRLYEPFLALVDHSSQGCTLGIDRMVQDVSEEFEDNGGCESSILEYNRLNIHKPQSPQDLSAKMFAENIEWAGVAESWFAEAPSRLGYDRCYDLAIDALMMVCWYRRQLPGATSAKLYRLMGAALDALHRAMSEQAAVYNDHILTTVAALSPVDAIRTGHCFLVPGHLDGVSMILASQTGLRPLSRVARRILEYHFTDTYALAVVRGIPSPFEAMEMAYCEYTDLSKPAAERKIRAVGNTLCVRLPQLVMLVRLACGPDTSGPTVLSALNLAEELLKFQDESAERDFVQAIGFVLTKLPRDRAVTEYSFNFKSMSSFEAVSYYSHSRTILLWLCCRLRASFPNFYDLYALPSWPVIQDELQRHATNIVMTVQDARTNRARKRRRLLGQSLLACWGTLHEFPNILTSDRGADETQSWLLENLNTVLLGRSSSLSTHDVKEATELFKGGPLVGRYKDLYSPPVAAQL